MARIIPQIRNGGGEHKNKFWRVTKPYRLANPPRQGSPPFAYARFKKGLRGAPDGIDGQCAQKRHHQTIYPQRHTGGGTDGTKR